MEDEHVGEPFDDGSGNGLRDGDVCKPIVAEQGLEVCPGETGGEGRVSSLLCVSRDRIPRSPLGMLQRED